MMVSDGGKEVKLNGAKIVFTKYDPEEVEEERTYPYIVLDDGTEIKLPYFAMRNLCDWWCERCWKSDLQNYLEKVEQGEVDSQVTADQIRDVYDDVLDKYIEIRNFGGESDGGWIADMEAAIDWCIDPDVEV